MLKNNLYLYNETEIVALEKVDTSLLLLII